MMTYCRWHGRWRRGKRLAWGVRYRSWRVGGSGVRQRVAGVKRRRGTFAVDPDARPITNEDVYKALEDFP